MNTRNTTLFLLLAFAAGSISAVPRRQAHGGPQLADWACENSPARRRRRALKL